MRTKNMGILIPISLALFAMGSLAESTQENHNIEVEKKADKYLPFRLHAKKWAVLVSGANGWYNYRHQADVYHAYQILRENGIPKENIITMAADDIAFHPNNPTPGKIINQPNGTNVYSDIIIDYKGDDVHSENFINIITGNVKAMQSIGSGKVIKGGPFDTIFINFVDHGSTGLLSFPNDLLYADQLNDALETMYSKRSYGKMLLYIEACRSGSMFDGILRDDTNILAVTASGPREDSWAAYCFFQAEPYGTCLGDLFSVAWMEIVEETVSEAVARKRTVFNNFSSVRTNVTGSDVMIYGDFNVGHEKLSTFIGNRPHGGNSWTRKPTSPPSIKRKKIVSCGSSNAYSDTVKHHYNSLDENSTHLQRQKLEEEISEIDKMRNIIDSVFRDVYLKIVKFRPDVVDETGTLDEPKPLDLTLDVFPCYRNIVTNISESCFSVPKNPYILNRLTFFANLCVVDQNLYDVVSKIIDDVCSTIPKDVQNVH